MYSRESYDPSLVVRSHNISALNVVRSFVSMNLDKFAPWRVNNGEDTWGKMGDTYGKDSEYVYIIKSKFDQLLNENGFDVSSFLGWAREIGMIETDSNGKNTVPVRINKNMVRCVKLKMTGNPSADVWENVRAVRCKNCKRSHFDYKSQKLYCGREFIYEQVEPEHFCSNGRPKYKTEEAFQ